MTFLEIIDKLIAERGINRNTVAKEVEGLTHGSFYAWQSRGTIPSAEILSKIADYFNVSVDYLLGKADNPAPPTKDITFDDFTYAFHEEAKELSEADKENLLDMARIFNQRRKERQQKEGE